MRRLVPAPFVFALAVALVAHAEEPAPPVSMPVERAATAPTPPPVEKPTAAGLLSKFKTSLYGFIEADFIGDSTQAFTEIPGNGLLARPGSYAATHPRFQTSVRNSRVGYKVEAPEVGALKATATLELDLFGNQPPVSEASFYANAGVRMRHANLKVESPWVDVLVGQHWSLFGWLGYFHPNSLEIQGLPGQVYARLPQLRVSHAFKTDVVNVELALAAVKPAQRDGAMPDFHGGLRALFPGRKAWRTLGGTTTVLDPGGLGVSAVTRQLVVPEVSAAPKTATQANGFGWSVDALVPVLTGTKDSAANSLSLTGSFTQGQGISDLFTGMGFGVGFPAPPNPTGATPAPAYAPGLDPGIVGFDASGKLVPVQMQSLLVGFQYFLPVEPRVWLTGNFAWVTSPNAMQLGGAAKIMKLERFYNAGLFWDVTSAIRVAVDYSYFQEEFADTQAAFDQRVHVTGFFLF